MKQEPPLLIIRQWLQRSSPRVAASFDELRAETSRVSRGSDSLLAWLNEDLSPDEHALRAIKTCILIDGIGALQQDLRARDKTTDLMLEFLESPAKTEVKTTVNNILGRRLCVAEEWRRAFGEWKDLRAGPLREAAIVAWART